jgi:tetratricopeptide (TPR) repeat protein
MVRRRSRKLAVALGRICFLILAMPATHIANPSLHLSYATGLGHANKNGFAVDCLASQQEPAQTGQVEESKVLRETATDLLRSGSLAEAEKQARTSLQKDPDSWQGHFLLGLILFRQGRSKESLAEYTEGAKKHDPSAEDLKIVALNYVLLGDFGEADRWLTKSITWNPNDAEAWYHLGRTKYNESRFEEALVAFQRCLQLEERNVKAKSNLGLALAGLGRAAEAQATYREAISWQAESASKVAEPYIDLGDLLLDQNQTDQAVALLMQANAISPEDVRIPEMLGKAYWRQNKLEDARVQLEKAVRLAPASAANHYLLGQVYRKQGMREKAKVEFDRAAELSASHVFPAKVSQ